MKLMRNKSSTSMGILLLLLGIPLLLWQAESGNQLLISQAVFVNAHSMMEVFSIIVSALIFFTGYGAHNTRRSVRALVLGYAFFAVAMLDMIHFLSYIGMPDLVSHNTPHKSILFWLAARFIAALGLLAYILLPEGPTISATVRPLWAAAVFVIVLLFAAPLLINPELAPTTFVAGQGLTPIKILLEWLMFTLYLGTAGILYVRRKAVEHCNVSSLILALLLMAVGELFFTLYTQVTNTANLLGHAYKVAAYYFLFRAIYAEAIEEPFRRMQKMLSLDELTGLANRTAFNERLHASLKKCRVIRGSCAVVLLDLDHFKNVNDTLGHELGDMLLVSVAGRLHGALPPSAFIARYSSDEFVILLERGDAEQAQRVAEKLLQAITAGFDLGADRIEISASIGIAIYPGDGDSASVLMRHADLAMNQAKRNGRNGFALFSRELADTIQRRVSLESRMKQALAHNEFSLHYQPKVHLGSGEIVGWEALLRWQSPDLGMISPIEFIPIAEQSGLILPIGDWVLREACRQLRAWEQDGLPATRVAVNLSTRQFRQRDLAENVLEALNAAGLKPNQLELEITESAIMDNLASAAEALRELAQLGVTIAVDDFGTGYSSLAYLKTFSIDCLKIDRSFIRDIPNDQDDIAIVRTVLALAESMGLAVVAEGVETTEQLAYLRENHCDQIQGYLFSRPLPPAGCAELVRSRKRLPLPSAA